MSLLMKTMWSDRKLLVGGVNSSGLNLIMSPLRAFLNLSVNNSQCSVHGSFTLLRGLWQPAGREGIRGGWMQKVWEEQPETLCCADCSSEAPDTICV